MSDLFLSKEHLSKSLSIFNLQVFFLMVALEEKGRWVTEVIRMMLGEVVLSCFVATQKH